MARVGAAIDVLDGVASLLDKSLIQQEGTPEGEPRFSVSACRRGRAPSSTTPDASWAMSTQSSS